MEHFAAAQHYPNVTCEYTKKSRFKEPYLHGAWAGASARNKMTTTCIRGIHADTRAGRCAACLFNTALHASWVVGAVASQVKAIRGAARG